MGYFFIGKVIMYLVFITWVIIPLIKKVRVFVGKLKIEPLADMLEAVDDDTKSLEPLEIGAVLLAYLIYAVIGLVFSLLTWLIWPAIGVVIGVFIAIVKKENNKIKKAKAKGKSIWS